MTENNHKIKKTDLTVTVLLIIGITAVLNYFAYQLFFRWDLTDGDIYSLSEASKRTASELDDIVNIKAYFSEDLPTQYAVIKQQASDLLSAYENYGGGQVRLSFIDPKDDEDTQRQLQMIGIPELTFNVISNDSYQLQNAYLGIAISYGDKTEVIPAVKEDNISNLEYQLTTAIKKVMADSLATIGYLASQGTMDRQAENMTAMAAIAELYLVEEVTLEEEDPVIGPEIDALIIADPKEPMNEAQLKAVNDYLKSGGAILALWNGVNVGENLAAEKSQSNLDELLAKYGVIIGKDLVADSRAGVITYTQGFFPLRAKYPFWPQIDKSGFNASQGPVSSLENVLLPWAGSVSIDEAKLGADAYQYLAFTTDQAWRVKDNFNIMPGNNNPQGDIGRFNLAVSVNGETADPYGADGERMPVRITAVSDADFIRENFLGGDNLIFFQNLTDSLSFDEDLINIRSKGASSRPIREISDQAKSAYKYGNVLGITAIVLAFGLARYYLRRKSRFADDI